MAKCPYCQKVTLLSEEEFEKSSFQCSHCKKIVANKPPERHLAQENGKKKEDSSALSQERGKIDQTDEIDEEEIDEDEIYDEEDEEDEETQEEGAGQRSRQNILLGGGLALLLGLGLFFTQKPREEVPVLTQVETVVPSIPAPEPVTPFVLQPLSCILPEEAVFGHTVTQITQANPALFAMNSQGKHWGNFEQGLTLPLDPPVSVGTIFYFFDAALTLQNLEFQLRPQDTQFSLEEVEQITQSLSLWYELVEQGELWYLWKATDGFLALSTQHQFLYVSDEEEKVRSVLH